MTDREPLTFLELADTLGGLLDCLDTWAATLETLADRPVTYTDSKGEPRAVLIPFTELRARTAGLQDEARSTLYGAERCALT